jgi:hypothetical protein
MLATVAYFKVLVENLIIAELTMFLVDFSIA